MLFNIFFCTLLTIGAVTLHAFDKFQWRGQSLFLGPKSKDIKSTGAEGLLFKIPPEDLPDAYPLPLIPESTPSFPGSRHFLFLNEMKFRELISESQRNYDSKLVRCFVSDRGMIFPEALKCQILESKCLKSGEIMVVIEAEDRVCIESMYMKPSSSFLTSTVTPSSSAGELTRDTVEEEEEFLRESEEACFKLYSSMKAYLRLVALRFKATSVGVQELEDNSRFLCLTPSIFKYRPRNADQLKDLAETREERHRRHLLFSYAVGNLMKSSSEAMQSILETDTLGRLQGLQSILDIANRNMRGGIIPKEDFDRILSLGDSMFDTAQDILPHPEWEELNLGMIELSEEGEEEGDSSRFEVVEDDDEWVMQ